MTDSTRDRDRYVGSRSPARVAELELREYHVITGPTLTVMARSPEEAQAILDAEEDGNDCPCGFPQWGEFAAAEGQELCECVESGPSITLITDEP